MDIKTKESFPEKERILLTEDKPNCGLVKQYHDALQQCETQLQEVFQENEELNDELEAKQEQLAQLRTQVRTQPAEILKAYKTKLLGLVGDWTKVGHNNPHGVVDNVKRIIQETEL